MDTFFTYLKKTLVATMFTIFAFVMVYTPQDWNKVEYAEAGGNIATETTQMAQFVADKAFQAVSIAKETITAFATNALWVKEYFLDGIFWVLAKAMVSSMVQSLVNWINSGFKGSPMFVQDLAGFLRNAADQAIGEYLDELGGIGSFLCDPFKLDVRVAVALQYQQDRVYQPAPKCTLTGVIDNIEGFLSGAPGSFSQGGWNDWFDITSQPDVYTPFGATLAAQSSAYIRIQNTRGEEATKLEWGSGFLSGEICNLVNVGGSSKEECFISKPGKIIQEALSFNLDSGRQSLITADEVDEILAALLGQLANAALTGVSGLLGLSSGTGYTYTGFAAGDYLSQMTQDSADTSSSQSNTLQTALQTQVEYRNLAELYLPQLQAKGEIAAVNEARTVINNTSADITVLEDLIRQYNSTSDSAEQASIMSQFSTLTLYSKSDIQKSQGDWQKLVQ